MCAVFIALHIHVVFYTIIQIGKVPNVQKWGVQYL